MHDSHHKQTEAYIILLLEILENVSHSVRSGKALRNVSTKVMRLRSLSRQMVDTLRHASFYRWPSVQL